MSHELANRNLSPHEASHWTTFQPTFQRSDVEAYLLLSHICPYKDLEAHRAAYLPSYFSPNLGAYVSLHFRKDRAAHGDA